MRALLVKDDVVVRETVCDWLTADGTECHGAGNAAYEHARIAEAARHEATWIGLDRASRHPRHHARFRRSGRFCVR
jgi:DNA-binding response OmpR family regulator